MGDVKDLSNTEAVTKLKELAEGVGVCMFCTELGNAPFSTRPMALQEVDEHGNFWFISSRQSNKNEEIKEEDKVQLVFAQTSNSHYLSVYGSATIFRDKNKIEEVWSPVAKAWFKEGKDDPDVTVIRVTPIDAYYWDTKDGKLFSLIKIATSMVTGKQADGGVEGTLNV